MLVGIGTLFIFWLFSLSYWYFKCSGGHWK